MTFNLYTVLAAIVIGAFAGATGARVGHRSVAASVLAAVVAGVVGTLFAIAATLVVDLDAFAVIHVVYLVLTIGVPLAFVILAATSPTAGTKMRLALLVPTLAVPVGIYASYVEPFWLRVDAVVVPADFDGPRIGVLSDLQTTSIGEHENDAVDELLARDPDIVLIPGDFSQLHHSELEIRLPEFRAVLARLDREVEHVVAVNGNTDTVYLLRQMAEGTGVVVLDNEVIDLDHNGRTIRIAGVSLLVDDARAEATVDTIVEPDGDTYRIILAHQPDEIFRLEPDESVDLLVAGHTHGGQVSLPFFGPPLTLSKVPRSVGAGGLHEMNGTWVYVSTGVGRERDRAPQMRFGVRPSVGIIEIGGR